MLMPLAAFLVALSAAPAPPPPHCDVLFICTGNYYRSRFAAAVFNAVAAATHSGCRATSRGLDISEPKPGNVSPLVCRELARHGLDCSLADGVPQALTQDDLADAAHIVVLDVSEHGEALLTHFDLSRAGWFKYWRVPDGRENAAVALPAIYRDAVRLHAELIRDSSRLGS